MIELYGLKITIAQNIYEPAEDTFLLISALEKLDLKNKTCLEIGTGTGIIALFLAKRAKKVLAVDINPQALLCAKENAARNGIKNAEFRGSDLFSDVAGKFDIIAFNPPYLPDEPLSKDIALDGGKDGRRVIGRFIKAAPDYLKKGGAILLLESSLSKYWKTLQYFRKSGFSADIAARERLGWEELVVNIYKPQDN